MVRGILMVCAVVLVSANVSRGDAAQDDLEKMKGDWTLVSTETNGKKRTADDYKEFSRSVAGDTYSLTIETEEGVQTLTIKIKLDPAQSPKTIDAEMTEGPAKGKKYRGIYKFEDDTQVICLAPAEKDRPTKFDSKEGTVTIWKRVKAPGPKEKSSTPDLARINDSKIWSVINADCEAVKDDGKSMVRMVPKGVAKTPSDIGLALVEGLEFGEGTLDVDLKGAGQERRIFLGLAFNAVDGNTFEAIYFRPFNFKADDDMHRRRAVQYVAWPDNTWEKLREGKPGKFEAAIKPVPDPSGWFHARVEVTKKKVSVWVDDAKEPCLVVDRLSTREKGKVGLWVDSREGTFSNLKITPAS